MTGNGELNINAEPQIGMALWTAGAGWDSLADNGSGKLPVTPSEAPLKLTGIHAEAEYPWSYKAQEKQKYDNWPQLRFEDVYQKGKCVLPVHNPYTLAKTYLTQTAEEPKAGIVELTTKSEISQRTDAKITKSQQMKNGREASRMLEKTLSDIKFSFSGREPANIFVYLKEVEIVLTVLEMKTFAMRGGSEYVPMECWFQQEMSQPLHS